MATKTAKITNGWHTICGYDVYVEGDRVMRGVTSGANQTTTYPYRIHYEWQDDIGGKKRVARGWDECVGITVDAFRAGIRRGTVSMF